MHAEADNFMSILCFCGICRIFNTVIKKGKSTQNNGCNDMLLTPGNNDNSTYIFYSTLSSSMKTGSLSQTFERIG